MDKGKKRISSGRTRIVYDLGNGYILKVPKNKAGASSNRTEFLLFNSRKSLQSKNILRKLHNTDLVD